MQIVRVLITVLATAGVLSVTRLASAQFIVQPTIASNTMGDQPGLEAVHLVDQSGLDAPYANGITNFDVYVPATAHHGLGSWNSAPFVSSGTMVFDLGAVYDVSGIAWWQASNYYGQAITTLSMRADLDGDFSNGAVTIGSYYNLPVSDPAATIIQFLPVTARYIECSVVNYGNGFGTTGREVAFRVNGPLTWTDLGHGKPGANGVPWLVADGFLNQTSVNHLKLSQARPLTAATLVVGLTEFNGMFKGGVMVPDPVGYYPLGTDGLGMATFGFVLPSGFPTGTTLYFQVWIQDQAATFGLSASNGLKGVTAF